MGDRATAIQLFNQAVNAAADKSNNVNLTTAYQLFGSACYADPTFWQPFYQSGNNNTDLNCHHAAVACWRRALECEMTDAERAKVVTNLSWRCDAIGHFDEALRFAEESVRLAPDVAVGWLNLSIVYGRLDRNDDMLLAARKAHELSPDDTAVQQGLAFALLFCGKLAEGFEMFECRFAHVLHSFTQYPYPKWLGEADKVLFLVADQGMGDTLCFARFIPEVAKRCKYVHVAVHAELIRLFQHAFVDLPNVDIFPLNSPFRQADYWSTFVSLPFALKLTDKQIRSAPPIKVPVYGINQSWKVPDRKLHVAIAWAGSKLNPIDHLRNIPLQHFAELYRVPGVQLYSLQVGERTKDLSDLGYFPIIKDLSGYVRDVVDTISLLKTIDLVICCESALAHICSTIGREVWVPYSYSGRDYRIGNSGDQLLWCPTHRIFRQGKDLRWESVFEKIVLALQERVGCL